MSNIVVWRGTIYSHKRAETIVIYKSQWLIATYFAHTHIID